MKPVEATSKDAAKGILPVPIGDWWVKGQTLRGGIITAELYKPTQLLLKNLIERDNAKPSFVFDKVFKIDNAPEAFREFSDHKLVKAVIQFDKKLELDHNDNGNGEMHRDPLEGEPVRKRGRH
jgi:threonine dehydrogenase-like Zn-dependent dehydrogenase